MAKLRKAVEMLPSGVSDMYQTTWKRIEAQGDDDVSLAKHTLSWLAYSLQVGSLSIIQLQHALAVDTEAELFDEDNITPEELITSVCCGLVTIDRASELVRLVRKYR